MAKVCVGSNSGQGVEVVETSAKPEDFRAKPLFDVLEQALIENGEEYVKKIKGVFCVKIKGKDGAEGVWIIDLKNGKGAVRFDPAGKGDVTITVADDDIWKLATDKLNPQQAFFQGKLKLAGNLGLAMKLREIQPKAKL